MNRLAVEQTGEPFFVRDRTMLESAMIRPVNRWHYGESDRGALAAQLLIGIARNHPFEQGNKRTALLAADGFLQVNGLRLEWPDDTLADAILAMIARDVAEDAFVADFAAAVALADGGFFDQPPVRGLP